MKTPPRCQINLDKVERRLTEKVKELKPEYSELELYQVAKMELKTRLLEEIKKLEIERLLRKNIKSNTTSAQDMGSLLNPVYCPSDLSDFGWSDWAIAQPLVQSNVFH